MRCIDRISPATASYLIPQTFAASAETGKPLTLFLLPQFDSPTLRADRPRTADTRGVTGIFFESMANSPMTIEL